MTSGDMPVIADYCKRFDVTPERTRLTSAT
jgi:hypothetical protein